MKSIMSASSSLPFLCHWLWYSLTLSLLYWKCIAPLKRLQKPFVLGLTWIYGQYHHYLRSEPNQKFKILYRNAIVNSIKSVPDCPGSLNWIVQSYLEPAAKSPLSKHVEHQTDCAGNVIVWTHSPSTIN